MKWIIKHIILWWHLIDRLEEEIKNKEEIIKKQREIIILLKNQLWLTKKN